MEYIIDDSIISSQTYYSHDGSYIEETIMINDYPEEELIRCEDCKFWEYETGLCLNYKLKFESYEYCSRAINVHTRSR